MKIEKVCSHSSNALYSRLHTGGAGENAAELPFTCMHVKVTLPINSKPELQVWVAVSLTELPVNVTMPFAMSAGSRHRASAAAVTKKMGDKSASY